MTIEERLKGYEFSGFKTEGSYQPRNVNGSNNWGKYGKHVLPKASRKEQNFGGILNFTVVELLNYRISR